MLIKKLKTQRNLSQKIPAMESQEKARKTSNKEIELNQVSEILWCTVFSFVK